MFFAIVNIFLGGLVRGLGFVGFRGLGLNLVLSLRAQRLEPDLMGTPLACLPSSAHMLYHRILLSLHIRNLNPKPPDCKPLTYPKPQPLSSADRPLILRSTHCGFPPRAFPGVLCVDASRCNLTSRWCVIFHGRPPDFFT